jgi:hypothetical protein
MRLESLVCGLLITISIIYLMDFLYLQRGLESRPCCEILYFWCTHIMRVLFCVFCMSIHWRSPPSLHATDNCTFIFTFYFKYFLRILCTFSLKYVLPPVLHVYSYSSRFIVNYFYFCSNTNSK